jgi:hypothetical protein
MAALLQMHKWTLLQHSHLVYKPLISHKMTFFNNFWNSSLIIVTWGPIALLQIFWRHSCDTVIQHTHTMPPWSLITRGMLNHSTEMHHATFTQMCTHFTLILSPTIPKICELSHFSTWSFSLWINYTMSIHISSLISWKESCQHPLQKTNQSSICSR